MKFGTALLTLAFLAFSGPAAQASDAAGVWANKSGKVKVRVSNCGNTICGSIVGLKEPISKIDGKPKVDRENPNPALRKRPIIGITVLIGMKPAGNNTWKGAIYNPDDGNTYGATLKLNGDTLKVQGCVVGILCKTNKFVRVQ